MCKALMTHGEYYRWRSDFSDSEDLMHNMNGESSYMYLPLSPSDASASIAIASISDCSCSCKDGAPQCYFRQTHWCWIKERGGMFSLLSTTSWPSRSPACQDGSHQKPSPPDWSRKEIREKYAVKWHDSWQCSMNILSNDRTVDNVPWIRKIHTSFISVSVWRISMSPARFLPMPFWEGGNCFLAWFFMVPLPLPAPGMPPPRPVDLLTPPWPGRCLIPGSPPSHRISSGEIYN